MTDRSSTLNRRRFLRGMAAGGAAVALGPAAWGAAKENEGAEPINVALIGAGTQGSVLMNACLKIPDVRFQAVCDLWEVYNLRRTSRILQRYGHSGTPYTDYEQMLDREKDLDAVLVATPDFWHARHTVASLDAGLHVYCEAPMANTIQDARRMVEAARSSGKLLQIGHQRRSNPQYRFCYEKLLNELTLLGKIVAVNGQRNRVIRVPPGWPQKAEIDPAVLKKYGYESMDHFRNWRWYKGLGGGPVVNPGSHQIDVYNWFLNARPKSVLAGGVTDHYGHRTHEWRDTVVVVYEYVTPQGAVIASYQTLAANRHQGHFERFLGQEGTLSVSERSDRTRLYPDLLGRDSTAWVAGLKQGYLTIPPEWQSLLERQNMTEEHFATFFVDESNPLLEPLSCSVPAQVNKPAHQPHLENFFDAIRGKTRLNYPAEVGYASIVAVLKVNEAVESGRRLEFGADEFSA